MEFTNHSDIEVILKLEHHGRPFRVSDCARFGVRVWTQNPNNFLFFSKREITQGEHRDRILIPDYYMNTLESGVLQYAYSYSFEDPRFKPFDGHFDHGKRVTTEIYWKNANLNQVPSNPVNYQTLNHIRDLIEQETSDRENAITDLREYVNSGMIDKLNEEIKRSNEVDIELFNKVKENAEIAENATKAVSDKLDAEIKRSNDVDIQLFEAIKKAGEDSGNIKEETDNKIEETNTALSDEIERAKAAERELTNNLTDEISRAKVKENELDAKIDGEISRAKVVENALTDAVDAVRDKANQIATDLAAEVSRSNQLDNDHTAALNDEVTRAKASEKAITDRLDVIEGDATVIGSIAHSLEDAKHYADDEISKALADHNTDLTTITNDLATEVSRATDAEKAITDRLDVIEGDATVIGSIAHCLDDAKHYTDDAISKANTDLDNSINSEVARATEAEKALSDRLDSVKASADKATADIVDLTNKDVEINNALNAEVSRATTKEGEIDAALAVINGDATVIGSIAHSLDDAKHYTDDEIAKIKTSTADNLNNAIKDFATKTEVDERIEGIIGTAPAALDTLGEIADRLAEDSDALNAVNAVLTGKANAADVYTKSEADAKHTQIATDINALNGAVENEVNRAKAAEKVNADNITALTTKVDGVKATADKAASDLVDEISRAKTAEADLTAKVNANVTNIEKNATDIATLRDDVDGLTTQINGAKTDLNALSNDLATEVTRATNKETELEAGVGANASKIADLTTRATATEGLVNTLSNDLTAEVTRAKGAEKTNADAITALTTTVDEVKATADKATADIITLNNEVDALQNSMDIVNGDATVIGSIAHSLDDAKHYTDDEISKLNAKVDASVTGFATKTEVANVDAKVDALTNKVNNIDVDAYTKAEVDEMIANVDVTDQLVDYAKTAETTVIKDENGVVITEMVIDNSEADDTIEVYTKAQCDERFALKGEASVGGEVDLSNYYTKAEADGKFITEHQDISTKADKSDVYTKSEVDAMIPQIVNLTQAEYDALTTKSPNTLYIVNG